MNAALLLHDAPIHVTSLAAGRVRRTSDRHQHPVPCGGCNRDLTGHPIHDDGVVCICGTVGLLILA